MIDANVPRIVEEGYSSALIIEDDMDWDVRLKNQLVQFARGARFSWSPNTSPPLFLSLSYVKTKHEAIILTTISSSVINT